VTITLTDEARAHLDHYLRQMRSALSGQLSVDVSDVERDIISHIDAELSGEPQPVGAQRLTGVLDRLGAPDRWLPVDDAPREQQTSERAMSGAAWGLPAVTLALLILGIFSFMRMILWPVPLLLMLLSILMARVWLTTVGQQEEDIGARRWFVYPPLVAIYAPIAGALIAWPLPLVGGAMTDDAAMRARLVEWFHGRSELAAPLIAIGALGVWWLILGSVLYRFDRIVKLAFTPFGDWFRQRHAMWLPLAGLLVAGGSAAALFWLLA
jgi:hypothetical protein